MRYLLLYLFILLSSTAQSQTVEKVIVHLKDGQKIEYSMSDVSFVEIVVPQATDDKEEVSIGGTIAPALDLGLSVLWAEHNLGASMPTDAGGRYVWMSPDLSAWGEGWRLPTDEEWEELYHVGSWEWTVRNGVAGRLITGTTGQSMFLPAAGISFGGNVCVNGQVGVYWTASSVEVLPTGTEAVGAYFDSANIYRIEYPKTNLFSVRLVKDK